MRQKAGPAKEPPEKVVKDIRRAKRKQIIEEPDGRANGRSANPHGKLWDAMDRL